MKGIKDFWKKVFNSPEECKFYNQRLIDKKELCTRKGGMWPFTGEFKCKGVCKHFEKETT